jgi:hypothetical protein
MRIVTATFGDAESALRAGERAREAAGPRATVRLFLSGSRGEVIETSIVSDTAPALRVALFGVALGVVFAMVVAGLGGGWALGLLALLGGALTGAMLGLWLTGEEYPRRILARGAYRPRYERALARHRAVVTAVVATFHVAERIVDIFETEGGLVNEGFLHEREPRPPELAPTT